jgi:hypothetical protein
MGQWMQGGMVMVGDMFNSNLRAIVDNVCQELCRLIASHNLFLTVQSGQFNANFGMGNNWWGQDLGSSSSSGSQNNIRYAYFPNTRRLAVEVGGHVTIYDTQDHQISGVSQQQGLGSSLTFTSQYGIVNTGELRIVSVDGVPFEIPQNPQSNPNPNPQPNFQSQPIQTGNQFQTGSQSYENVFTKIEKLAELRQKGILSDDEFNAKKADLLSKI